MSVLVVAFGLKPVGIALFFVALVTENPWLVIAAICVTLVAMFWPRCYRCGLPAFWRRRKSDPDHFMYYLGNWPDWPGSECSRCGEDLTVGRLH